MLQFSEAYKKKTIDQFLDLYNRYMDLYHLLGDIHFKQEAEHIMVILNKHFTPSSQKIRVD